MTKREFERFKRYAYEHSDEVISGYITVHEDCPQLSEKEKKLNWTPHLSLGNLGRKLWFGRFGSNFIKDDKFIILIDPRNSESKERHIHFKWVSKCTIYGIYKWEDKGGKRDSKLNWYLKNLKQ